MAAWRQVRNGNVEFTVETAGYEMLTCGSTNKLPVVPRFNTRDKEKLTNLVPLWLVAVLTGPTVPSMTNGVLRLASGGGEMHGETRHKRGTT